MTLFNAVLRKEGQREASFERSSVRKQIGTPTSALSNLFSETPESQRSSSAPPLTGRISKEKDDSLSISAQQTHRLGGSSSRSPFSEELPFEKVDFNVLAKEKIEAIAAKIECFHYSTQHKKETSQRELLEYFAFINDFTKIYESSLNLASTLHHELKNALGDCWTVDYDNIKRIITTSHEVYVTAIALALINFKGVMALAKTETQCRQVAHLMQTMLVGTPNGCMIPIPFSSESFCLTETQNRTPFSTKERRVTIFDKEKVDHETTLKTNFEKGGEVIASSYQRFLGQIINNNDIQVVFETEDGQKKLKSVGETLSVKEFIKKYNAIKEKPPKASAEISGSNIGSPTISFCLTEDYESSIYDEIGLEKLLSGIPHSDRKIFCEKDASGVDSDRLNYSFLDFLISLPLFDNSYLTGELINVFSEYKFQYEGEGKDTQPISVRPTKWILTLDRYGRCIDLNIDHSLYIATKAASEISFTEDVGDSMRIATLHSSIADSDIRSNSSWLNSSEQGAALFDHVTWDWRMPEPIEQFILKQAKLDSPGTLSLNRIIFFFKQVEKVFESKEGQVLTLNQDLSIRIQKTAWLNGYWNPWAEAIEVDNKDDLKRLRALIENIAISFERHKKIISLTSKRPKEDLAEFEKYFFNELAFCNEKLSQLKGKGNEENVENRLYLIDPLLNSIKNLLSLNHDANLIKPIKVNNEKGVVDRFKSAFLQSTDSAEIGWKVERYQSMLLQLKKGLRDVLSKYCSNDEIEDYFAKMRSVYSYSPRFDTALDKLTKILLNPKIEDVEVFTQDTLDSFRNSFTSVIKLLRDLLGKTTLAPDVRNITEDFCSYLFTGVSLERESIGIMKLFDVSGDPSVGKSLPPGIRKCRERSEIAERLARKRSLHESVSYSHKAPIHHQIGNSARGYTNTGFDPILQANLPHVLGEVLIESNGVKRSIKLCGLGTPTTEPYLTWAKMNPEFVAWMLSYKREGKKHLYVNNQNLLKYIRPLGGIEKDRIKAISDMADDPGLNDTYYTVLLSKDSSFYYQSLSEGELARLSNPEEFKDELIKQHFDLSPSISGNIIPKKILEAIPTLKEDCKNFVDKIQTLLFHDCRELSVRQRQTFIDIFHDLLTINLVNKLNVNSFNITCKDGIDRAAEGFARLRYHLSVINDTHKEKDFLDHFEAFLFARAIMVRKRTIIDKRLKRLIVDFLATHSEGLKQLHREVFSGVKFSINAG